ncbi:hypothetical protein ACLOJK_003659 [Asimina triloba]
MPPNPLSRPPSPTTLSALCAHHDILTILLEFHYDLHTTLTPQFLGLDTSLESKSFNNVDLYPAPASWKGECEWMRFKASTSCNKKPVSARFFAKGYEANFGLVNESSESRSPRDDDGHDTHITSIVATQT